MAIFLALKSLGLSSGARIGVPLYCCPVVFKAVVAAGCEIRFLDIDPTTYCISPEDLSAKSSGLDAVIAVHMFGNVCDVPTLKAIAPWLPYIEDCAQSLGSELHGAHVGTFGDLAAFSFHSGKYLSVGDGGALYSSREELRAVLSDLIAQLRSPGRLEEASHVAKTFLRSSLRRRPLWGLAGVRVWREYGKRVAYGSQSPIAATKMLRTDYATAVRRLPLLQSWIETQRMWADYYLKHLEVDAGSVCVEPAGARYNRLQFPLLLATSEQCTEFATALRNLGIGTARPYQDIAKVAAEHYGYSSDCPGAERVASSVLVVPAHYALRSDDVERIAEGINRVWSRTVPRPSA